MSPAALLPILHDAEPWFDFRIAIARRTDSSVGVVMASSYALVCSELHRSWMAKSAWRVVYVS